MSIQTVMQEIDTEYENRLSEIKESNTYDIIEMSGSKAEWKEVLTVYSVKVNTDTDNPQDVVTMDEGKRQLFKDIFWEMNSISSLTESKEETVVTESDDVNGNAVRTETTVTKTYLYITVTHKTTDEMLDVINNISYVYEYDLTGRLVRSYSTKGTSKLLSTENQYDDQNRIKSATYILPNNAKQRYFYSYSSDNLITGVSLPASSGLSYSYDDLNRRTLRRIAGQNVTTQAETYSYYSPGQYVATNLVNKITYADNSTLSYIYNANNCITSVTDENGKRITYKYDGMGQLIRENNPYTNLTTVYSYDKGGNITSAKEYAYTTAAELGTVKKTNTYTYGDSNWKDKLTAYNGKTITYDKIGNPMTYRDSLSFKWKNGRQLASLQNGSSVINYTYNTDGVRIGKSGSRAGTFIVSGTQILREINSVATIDYLYDENGSPIGLTYKGTTYYYRKNLQGDIINITDSTGAKVVTYTYNAWGKIMSMTGNMELAVNNPFRYRGYYYDVESGLYYLNSRYYDPQTGRFINAEPNVDYGKFDEGAGLNGYNVFAYCANNPVMFKDDSGEFVISISIGIGSLLTWATYGIATAVGVGAGVAIGTAVADNIKKAQAFDDAIDQADSKIRRTVKRNSKTRFWEAFTNGRYVSIGRGLTFNQAVNNVKKGKHVFAVTKLEAESVARVAGGKTGRNNKPLPNEIDRGKENIKGYYYHFHTYNRKGGHVFYMF